MGYEAPTLVDELDRVWHRAWSAWAAREDVADAMAAARRLGAVDGQIARASGLSLPAVDRYIADRHPFRGRQPPRYRTRGSAPVWLVRRDPYPDRTRRRRPRRRTSDPASTAEALEQVWRRAQSAYRAHTALLVSLHDAHRRGATDALLGRASGLDTATVRAHLERYDPTADLPLQVGRRPSRERDHPG